jgi:tight adherence protein C
MTGPWLGTLGGRAGPHLPAWWRRRTAARLEASGARLPDALPLAVGRSVVAVLVGGLVATTALWTAGRSPVGLVGMAVGVVVGVLPEVVLQRRIRARRDAMARDLPRHLDLLTISVEAGLAFDAALGRVVQAVPGALADEFARMLGEVRAGRSRDEAMRDLGCRCGVPEVRSVVLAMVQADRFGVSVGPLLRTLAGEVRARRRLAAQAQAHKAPVKLLVPLVVCVFPALLVVVAGPALLAIRGLFAS